MHPCTCPETGVGAKLVPGRSYYAALQRPPRAVRPRDGAPRCPGPSQAEHGQGGAVDGSTATFSFTNAGSTAMLDDGSILLRRASRAISPDRLLDSGKCAPFFLNFAAFILRAAWCDEDCAASCCCCCRRGCHTTQATRQARRDQSITPPCLHLSPAIVPITHTPVHSSLSCQPPRKRTREAREGGDASGGGGSSPGGSFRGASSPPASSPLRGSRYLWLSGVCCSQAL